MPAAARMAAASDSAAIAGPTGLTAAPTPATLVPATFRKMRRDTFSVMMSPLAVVTHLRTAFCCKGCAHQSFDQRPSDFFMGFKDLRNGFDFLTASPRYADVTSRAISCFVDVTP
ncbi:exported hypothetical protein [Thiomonas sp. CB3]|nr:exported hypothetical protein [Thiomonas sp. CB3]